MAHDLLGEFQDRTGDSAAGDDPATAIQFELALLSERGGRAVNEDACGHWHSDHHLCCVVADGAGGHGGGDAASRCAVRYLIDEFAARPAADVEAMLRGANDAVRLHRADAATQRDMHSTVVALFVELDSQRASWGHVGDSRLYLFRAGRVHTRTRDHSVVQMLVDQGALRDNQIRSHPRRSELLCALGSEAEDLSIGVALAPCEIEPGDVFLLCTDGMWEHLSDEVLEATLQQSPDPQVWLAALEHAVLQQVAGKTRYDNFSAVTLWARPAD
ncbi:protein phosphatase 2C domain-containing protein [soil metagenome]